MEELTKRIEAFLFASGKGISEATLADYADASTKKIQSALAELQKHYEDLDSALTVTKREDVWKLTVRGKYTKEIEHIASETELPPAILKTLAVIAYKSPVMQADVVNMRGQQSYDHIKLLAKQQFITKEEKGRTFLLKITDKFYNYFDVEGDEEIREVFEKLRAMQPQQKLGELEVVDASDAQEIAPEQQKEQSEELGRLEVVDVEPRRKKSDEDVAIEKEFLESMDKRIEELSSRIQRHRLPEKQQESEQAEEETSSAFEKEEDEEDYL